MNFYDKYNKYKQKYFKLKHQHIQKGGVYNINANNIISTSGQMNSDTGAGIILLEDYNMGTKRELSVILFKNAQNGMYMDGGGTRDNIAGTNSKEDLRDTARRELKEESANLFRLDKSIVNDNASVRHLNYVGYIIYVQGPKDANNKHPIFSQLYSTNLQKIQQAKSNLKAPYTETNGITRVTVNQLIKDNIHTKQGDFPTTDAKGNNIIIQGKTKAIIRNALKANLINLNNNNFIELKLNNNFNPINPQDDFLKGTQCYYT